MGNVGWVVKEGVKEEVGWEGKSGRREGNKQDTSMLWAPVAHTCNSSYLGG
jgi:hypothetical protein